MPGLRLGTTVADADDGSLQNAAATADDSNGTDDEDGVTSFPSISTVALQVITVPVSVTNTTGGVATLVGYLDFNKDGDFLDTGEQSASVSVAANATAADVVFTAPTGLTPGTTYARFRISSTATEVTSSVGAASSGEVEDYLVNIGSPDLTIAKSHTGNFTRGSSGTYTLTVGNSGNTATSGTITVTDTLPANFTVNGGAAGTVTAGGANGANWNCSSNAASPQIITCTSATAIAVSGSSVFTLTVNVGTGAAANVTNSAAVSGGGEAAANNGNNTANDATITVAPTDLTLTKSHAGSFTVGQTGVYSFSVNNIGGTSSSGTITVTDTLPAGLSLVAGSTTGSGWSCSASGQTVTCSNSTAAITAAGSSTFGFSVVVGTGTAAGTNSITNTASVAGGGDSNTANNSANGGNGDPTTILSPNLTVSKSHTPATFVRGSTGTYTITVGNTGTAPTSGTVTVTDTLPTGLTIAAGTFTPTGSNGAAWSCSASGQTVTCTSTTAIATSGSSVFSFAVAVGASTALPSVTNNVAVSGGNEATALNTNNTGSDVTPTATSTDLTISKTASGTFVRGSTGSYTLTVSNSGGTATSGTVTVSDTLPAGLSYRAATGTGWSCSASGQSVTCTRAVAVPAGGSAPPITLTVNVLETAPASAVNTATVSGGGDATPDNNSSTATTPILSAGSLSLAKTVQNLTLGTAASSVGNSGQPGDTLEYCIAYSNPDQSQVTGAEITDDIPDFTVATTAVADYGGLAIRWRVTAPTASTQNFTAEADADAGTLSSLLSVTIGTVPAGGAGDVCFRVSVE